MRGREVAPLLRGGKITEPLRLEKTSNVPKFNPSTAHLCPSLPHPHGSLEDGGAQQPQRPPWISLVQEQSTRKPTAVFCLQACRGAALDQGVFVETDSGQPEPASFSEYLHIPPNTAVMFACSPGEETPKGSAGSRVSTCTSTVLGVAVGPCGAVGS